MGGGIWDSDSYDQQGKRRRDSGQQDFAYSDATARKTRSEQKSNPLLDPRGINGVRESRDSDEHPESRAIAVFFDVTGSMGVIPRVFQTKLADLMDVVRSKAGIEHPHILTGAIGDATCDRVPLQISQFESDNRIDEQLRLVFLEGGGGGQVHESYGLAYYAAALKTALDCYEKRGQKGYLFTMGDERVWPVLSREELSDVFGDAVERNYSIEELVAEAQKTYEVFHIIVTSGQHGKDPWVEEQWRSLLGERVLRLDNPELVCEVIASTIAVLEGAKIEDLDLDAKTSAAVKKTIAPAAKRRRKAAPPDDADAPKADDDGWRL